jgi:hypothetical protein
LDTFSPHAPLSSNDTIQESEEVVNIRTRQAWVVMLGLLLLAGCKSGTLPSGAGGTSGSTAGGMLTAGKLCDDYKAGQATADSNYKGKDIQVKGQVLNVRPDPATKAKFVMLKGSEGGSGTRGVRCYFVPEAAADVDKLKSGDEIKVQGTCQGRMSGTTGDSFDVELKNCKLVK